ncbi:hypothetical protein [Yimella lutea]|uniref:hypothetical protein n=1 Tax=Yimella lutea TaxID=587872 RepID=UPI0011531D1F|nr:hypothetical protein [Yimella lutea]
MSEAVQQLADLRVDDARCQLARGICTGLDIRIRQVDVVEEELILLDRRGRAIAAGVDGCLVALVVDYQDGHATGDRIADPLVEPSQAGGVLLYDENNRLIALKHRVVVDRSRVEVAPRGGIGHPLPVMSGPWFPDPTGPRASELTLQPPLRLQAQTVVDSRQYDDDAVTGVGGLGDESAEVPGFAGLHVTQHEASRSEGRPATRRG